MWTSNFIIEHDISSWSDGYAYTESIEASTTRRSCGRPTRPTLVPGMPYYNLLLPEHI